MSADPGEISDSGFKRSVSSQSFRGKRRILLQEQADAPHGRSSWKPGPHARCRVPGTGATAGPIGTGPRSSAGTSRKPPSLGRTAVCCPRGHRPEERWPAQRWLKPPLPSSYGERRLGAVAGTQAPSRRGAVLRTWLMGLSVGDARAPQLRVTARNCAERLPLGGDLGR